MKTQVVDGVASATIEKNNRSFSRRSRDVMKISVAHRALKDTAKFKQPLAR
jgi:hypothetical protein